MWPLNHLAPFPFPAFQIIPDADWPGSWALGSSSTVTTPIPIESYKFSSTVSGCLLTGVPESHLLASSAQAPSHAGSRAVTLPGRLDGRGTWERWRHERAVAEAEVRGRACPPGRDGSCSSRARPLLWCWLRTFTAWGGRWFAVCRPRVAWCPTSAPRR